MRRIAFVFLPLVACFLLAASPVRAQDAQPFPDDWFALAEGEAGIVFMIRSYGADFGFDLFDENGAALDRLTVPKGVTAIVQYRVPRGAYPVTAVDRPFQARGQPGFFAAMGIAVTHEPAAGGKAERNWPDFQPFATYTADSMRDRLLPLVGFGPTEILAPKPLAAKTLDLRLVPGIGK